MEAKKKTFVEELKKQLGNISKACDAVQINRQTYYNWMEKDAEFKSVVDYIDEYIIDFAENSLFKQIQEGNTAATIFYLKCKAKKRGYVERQDVINTNLNYNVELTKEEIKEINSALENDY